MMLSHTTAEHLARSFGSRWREVWSEIDGPEGSRRIVGGLPYRIGELRYSVRREMACTLADLLIRRTHIAFETRDHGLAIAPAAAQALGSSVGGDSDTAALVRDYEREVDRIFSIDG